MMKCDRCGDETGWIRLSGGSMEVTCSMCRKNQYIGDLNEHVIELQRELQRERAARQKAEEEIAILTGKVRDLEA